MLLFRYADLRYHGQEHTIRVQVPYGTIRAEEIKIIKENFVERHKKEYGFVLDAPIELVNLHLTGVVNVAKPLLKELDVRSNISPLKYEREVFWGNGWEKTPVYEKKLINPGMEVQGPAILEEETSTVIVKKGQKASVDKYGNLLIKVIT